MSSNNNKMASPASDEKSLPSRDFHVSILGGGIGGISAAIGLLRAGVPVDVFEAAAEYGEIGAGISFGKNARTALEWLGLGNEFERQATTVASGIWFEWREGTGEKQELIASTYSKPHGNSSVHRAKFLDAMSKHVPKHVSHFGKRLKHIETLPTGSARLVRMHFEDESTFDTDVVIGYDGIHSRVREHILGKRAPLQWSGTWAYRGLIPTKRFIEAVGAEKGESYARQPQMFVGKDTHVLVFPIDKHETVNLVAFHTDRSAWPQRASLPTGEAWTQPTTTEHMISQFPGWGADIINMMKCMDNPSKWALHQLVPTLDTYVKDTVCIAGDAAHGGTPHQGAMAGQAMEDAVFLSWLLAQPGISKSNVAKALQLHNTIRLPRANRVLSSSLQAGDVYEFAGPQGADHAALKQELESRFDWIWEVRRCAAARHGPKKCRCGILISPSSRLFLSHQ